MEITELWCNECNKGFPISESDTFHSDEGDDTLCPYCGSNDLEDAITCKICLKIIPKRKKKSDGYCPQCFEDAVQAYKACHLPPNLQPWQRECLEYEYGNIDITEG